MMGLRNLGMVAALWAAFWLIAPFVERIHLFVFVDALVTSIALGVITAYAGGLRGELFGEGGWSAGHYLIVGVILAWIGASSRLVWSWAWRYNDRPDWMQDHMLYAFFAFMIFTGGIFHLAARDAIEGKVPKKNWLYIGGVIALAVFLTIVGAALFDT